MLRSFVLKFKYNNKNIIHQFLRNSSSADYELKQEHIDEAIKLNPTLKSFGEEHWTRTHKTFTNHGLTTLNFLRIVTEQPSLLNQKPERIISSLEQWRCSQFGEKNVHLLITKYPELLDIEASHLHKQIVFLKLHLGNFKNVWKAFMNCPDLLEQSEENIEKKMEYMTKVMRLEIPEIVKSCALSKTYDEIRCRHVFQVRLGIFKPRSPKANPMEPSTNTRLYKITDTSDKSFATKICHVTLEEYEVFKELYMKELQKNKENIEHDVDDDSDDDEINNIN